MKKRHVILGLSVMLMLLAAACGSNNGGNGGDIKMGYGVLPKKSSIIVATVAMQGDKVAGCVIDELALFEKDKFEGVVFDGNWGEKYPDGMVMGSKKVNDAPYTAGMSKAGAKHSIKEGIETIEAFCKGKTADELKKKIEGVEPGKGADVISGCTLSSMPDYMNAVIAAVESAGK